jgi:asparagine synthase (glutamine-hydrolysing)
MCGIAGIVQFAEAKPIAMEELTRMAQSLAHRGPDDSGIYLDVKNHRCGLAHRRLSVIDLEGGHQPMSNADESIWITYNGECYNFQELRKELTRQGHHFKTNSDTEVIIHLYEQYGVNCVDHMRGMFAFALWDIKKNQLMLARDRLGQKPLYYAVYNNRFIFASQCKAILESHEFPRRPDRQSILSYLLLQYVPQPETAFTNIRQIPPGHIMVVNQANFQKPGTLSYWSPPAKSHFEGSFPEAVDQVRATLAEAIRLRLVSDVPLGAFLSGGIDSAIIVGLMSQLQSDPVETCSIGFDDKGYDELPLARVTASRHGCRHHDFVVEASSPERIGELCDYYDEPFADHSALPTYVLSRLARSKVTVALTGDGGDECYGGYDRYRAMVLSEKLRRIGILKQFARMKFWQRLSTGQLRSMRKRVKRFITGLTLPPHQRYLNWICLFNPDRIKELCDADLIARQDSPPEWDRYADDFSQAESSVIAAMRTDLLHYLPGDLNVKTDRASMATGLELRCPFQDHKVVELASTLPENWKIKGGTGKFILRRAFDDIIPAEVRRQPKRGFGLPVGQWFRESWREILMDTVLSPRALQRGYFDGHAVRNLVEENDRGQDDHGHRLWALLMLELWHRKYIDR